MQTSFVEIMGKKKGTYQPSNPAVIMNIINTAKKNWSGHGLTGPTGSYAYVYSDSLGKTGQRYG